MKLNLRQYNNSSLFTTLLLTTLAPLIAVSLLLLFLALYLLVSHERTAVVDRLSIVAAAMANEAQTYLAFDQPGYFQQKANIYIGSGKAHGFRLYDINHNVVAQVGEVSDDAIKSTSPVLDTPDPILFQPESLEELALPPAVLPADIFETIGYVEASYSLQSYLLRVLVMTVSTAIILLFSIIAVIAYAYRKTDARLLEPIRRCQNYVKQLTAGEYSASLPVQTNIEELASLAESAKVLSKQLRKNDRMQLERTQEQAKHASELNRALQSADERRQQDLQSVSQIVNNTIKSLDSIQSYSTAIAARCQNPELTALSRGLSASINAAIYSVQDGINFFGESTLKIDSVTRVISTKQLVQSLQAGFNGSQLDLDCNIHFEADYDNLYKKHYVALDHQRLLQLLNYITQNLIEHSIDKKLVVTVKNVSADPNSLVLQVEMESQSVFDRQQVYNTHKYFNEDNSNIEKLMFSANRARIIKQLSASLGVDINCLSFVNNRASVSLNLQAPLADEPSQLDSLTVPNHLSIIVVSNDDIEIEYTHLLKCQGIALEKYTMSTFRMDERMHSLPNPVFFVDATIPAEASHFAKDIYRVIPNAKVVGMILRHQDYREATLDLIDHNLDGLITIPIATADLVAKAQQVIEIFDTDPIQTIMNQVLNEEEN